MSDRDPIRHTTLEDAIAFLLGTILVSIGLEFFRDAGIAIGGTAGIAFILHYLTNYDLGLVYFVINLPFYVLSFWAMGWVFTVKTFVAVALLSAETTLMPKVLTIAHIHPLYAAVAGGLVIGMGILALVRHQASLGGVNMVAFYLQNRFGWRAGKVQMGIDCAIVISAFLALDWVHVALSVVSAISMNLMLALNHRPGRYNGF
jgi:uncharacterized membrane-anchored protein YitT (DUF2179 family)